MLKVKDFLIKINPFILIFILIGLRIVGFGASIGDAIVITALCSLKGFNSWIDSQKKDTVNEQLAKELIDLKSMVTNLNIKNSVKPQTPAINPDLKRFF